MSPAGRRITPVRRGASLMRRQRALLPYYAFRAGQVLAAPLPRRVAHRVAGLAADAAVRFRPARFAALRDNLAHVVPAASPGALDALLRVNVRGVACGWSDVLQLRSHRRQMARRLYTVNTGVIRRAMGTGRGAVVVSLHCGSWEAGLSAWAYAGHPMAVLAERLEPQELFDAMVSARSGLGLDVIPLDTRVMRGSDGAAARRLGAAAMREVVRVLRRNGAVAIAIDRDLIGNGELMPFFGAPAPIPLGVVDVAMRAGAAIIPTFLINEGSRVRGEMHDEIPYDPAAPRVEEVRRVTSEVLAVCEAVIRRYPEQWHVLSPIWGKSP